MRLLAREEIIRKQAEERAQVVNEAAKLGRQIDGLRELRARTDKDYEAYRLKSLSAIGVEIKALGEKKQELEKEIAEKKAKAEWIIPALEKKKKELDAREQTLDLLLLEAEERIVSIKMQEKEAAKRMQELNLKAKTAELRENEAIRLQNEAISEKATTKKGLERLERDKYTFEQEKSKTDEHLSQKTHLLEAKQAELETKESELRERELQVEKDKRWIADRRGLLQRNFERLKKLKNNDKC